MVVIDIRQSHIDIGYITILGMILTKFGKNLIKILLAQSYQACSRYLTGFPDIKFKIQFLGVETTELSVSNKIFKLMPDILLWKISFTITSLQNGILSNGTSDLLIKINELPYNGKCSVDKNKGYALETYFLIKCINWLDNDGYIVKYEYFGWYI